MKHLVLLFTLCFCFATSAVAQDDDQGFLTRQLEEALGGAGREIKIHGFKGVLTSKASFETLTIADGTGVWLTLNDVVLDWKRTALLRGRVEVNELTAKSMELKRLPESIGEQPDTPTAEAQGFSLPELPVSININAFSVEKIILGAPLLGEAMELSLDASARLEDGALDLKVNADRTDRKMGKVVIDISFDQATEALALKLEVIEEEGGIAARLLNLPGHPEIDLTIDGTGLLRDFVAQVSLASGGVPRLTGQVELTAQPIAEEEAKPIREIRADLGGDIAALFAPKYQPFFGNNIALKLDVLTADDGGIDVRHFSVVAQQAMLEGQVRLNSDYWPIYLDIDAAVQNADETVVLLPVAGPETRISSTNISVQYDAAEGDRLHGVFDVQDFSREGIAIDQARLEVDGTLQGNVGSVGQLLANIDLTARGLELADPDLAAAVGTDLMLSTHVNYIEGQPVRLTGLSAKGADYGVTGDVIIGAPGGGGNTRLDVKFEAGDLSRFGGLAGREIGGAALVSVLGSVAPLSGKFDVQVKGRSTDLAVGQVQADILLKGVTNVDIAAARTTEGIEVTRLMVKNDAVEASGNASLRSAESRVEFDAKLRDIALVLPAYSGPVSVGGTASQDANGWSVDLAADGPYRSSATLAGRVTGPDGDVEFQATLPDMRVFVPEIHGPLSAKGRAKKSGHGWQLDVKATGPSGTRADIAGLVKENGDLDLTLAGTVPLGLSTPFLKPRILQGQASYDLAVRGPPAFSSVTGEIKTASAVFYDPNLRLTLSNIATTVRLKNQVAHIDMTGALSAGGTVSVSGPVKLSGGFNADLGIRLAGAKLVDPLLYKTVLDGSISMKGPLLDGARISGQITVGATEISVPASGLSTIEKIPEIKHIASSRGATVTRERAGLIREEESEKASGRGGGGAVYPLDIQINAPSRIFVRGRGLDAELGGRVRLTGTTAAIRTAGRFDLVRGHIDILTQRYTLDEGEIQMQGGLLPYIRFVSSTETDEFTAKIILEGPVDEPEVSFESSPEAPEDEVLAQLLFGSNVSDMSAFQALRLANAVALLAGSGGVDVISQLRSGFGLDNLDIITNEDGTTEVKIGKYISETVYTDISANSDGTNEVSLNMDLTPSFTVRGSVDNEGGSSVGLFFERDY